MQKKKQVKSRKKNPKENDGEREIDKGRESVWVTVSEKKKKKKKEVVKVKAQSLKLPVCLRKRAPEERKIY